MKKEFLEAGKIVGTHGIGGTVRIDYWTDSAEFLCKFDHLFIGDEKSEIRIKKMSAHKNIVLASIEGVTSIESAERLRGKIIDIKRSDAHIPEGRYFIEELIGSRVFDAETGVELGIISDVSSTLANDVWCIKKDGKEYLVPVIEDVMDAVDIDSGTVKIKPLKGIFEDAD